MNTQMQNLRTTKVLVSLVLGASVLSGCSSTKTLKAPCGPMASAEASEADPCAKRRPINVVYLDRDVQATPESGA